MTSEHIPVRLQKLVRRRAQDCCEYCRLPQSSQEATFHIDHITPRTSGGLTVRENLALACVGCSLRKGSQTRGIDPETGTSVRLFHPRRDDWNDHFFWDSRWILHGLTILGRATIKAIQLNRPVLVRIRIRLASRGEFLADG